MILKRRCAGITLQRTFGEGRRYVGVINGQPVLFASPTKVSRWVATVNWQHGEKARQVANGFTLTMCVNAAKEELT